MGFGQSRGNFCFFKDFDFIQTKEKSLLQVQPLKMVNKLFLLIIGLQAKLSQFLRYKSRQLSKGS